MGKFDPVLRRRILAVAFPSITETELAVLDGIREAVGPGRHWEIVVLTGGYESILRQLAEMKELAGAIGDFVSDAWVQTLCVHGVKVVQLAHSTHMKTVAAITADYEAMGRGAAQTLRSNGAGAFAFLGAPGQHASNQLFQGFAGALSSECKRSSGTSLAQIREFLRPQPRPLGLFAASDRLARFAVLAARELGWRVPEELAVIGVGNVRLESLYAGIPLSSYELPGRELGRIAARWLLKQLNGTAADGSLFPQPAGFLHERKSSLRSPTGLERALSYARSNLDQPLPVADLCRIAGMSRRSLENAMQMACGASPAVYLQNLRKERAQTLLRTTQMGIQSIARTCGYLEPCVFSTAFRRWTGMSPSGYRARTGPTVGAAREE
ncbi:MAG: helix-turn-helix domain-containing protein [Verrucomicrobia bacterium]|nr:helix-turn-helix domain-containing protein [Verrucomicrobiota bacterium]